MSDSRAWLLVLLACAGPACNDRDGDGPSPDFPSIASTPGRHAYELTHDGVKRVFIVYVPEAYSDAGAEEWPLMVSLHGGGGSAAKMFSAHPLERYGDELGYVMVAAQGTPKPDAGFEWNGYLAFDNGDDDVGYLERVIVEVSAALRIDPARRYVAGFSGGATMTVRFATERSELVAAIGTFAGKVGRSADEDPPLLFPPVPTTPLSVQMTYGTEDDNYAGGLKDGVLFTSAVDGIAWWSESLDCDPTPVTEVDDLITFDTHAGCAGDTVVEMVTVDGMEHMWPDEDDGLDGTRHLLDFFADKTKPL